MKEAILKFISRYGLFVFAGLIGAIVHRLRHTMSFKRFISVLLISAFVGLCTGVFLKDYVNPPEEVLFVICSLCGVFSKDILDQAGEIIDHIAPAVKKFLDRKSEK